jgi:hypothetical protein
VNPFAAIAAAALIAAVISLPVGYDPVLRAARVPWGR